MRHKTQKGGFITVTFYCDECKIYICMGCQQGTSYATFGSAGLPATLKKPQIQW